MEQAFEKMQASSAFPKAAHKLWPHLDQGGRAGDGDQQEVGDGQVEEEGVVDFAEGGREEDGGDDQEVAEGGEEDDGDVNEEEEGGEGGRGQEGLGQVGRQLGGWCHFSSQLVWNIYVGM